jgi:hypothetical protein
MKSFIRAIELWKPDEAGTSLEYAGGAYDDDLEEFREISELALFAHDQGLPGKAWAAGHPIILTDFADSYFRRADEARLFGLSCAVAIPVFDGERIKAVVGLLCGSGAEEYVGAIELWHNNAELSHEMTLVDGFYGAATNFELGSRHTKFLRGYGLPGRAWKAGAPVLIKDIGENRQFLRAEDAAKSGMTFGLAIPYSKGGHDTWVISLLSALRTPIARRCEIWRPDSANDALTFESGYCGSGADLDAIYSGKVIRRGEGALGQAFAANMPVIGTEVTREASVAAKAAASAGLRQIVVIPVLNNNELKAVVAWYP